MDVVGVVRLSAVELEASGVLILRDSEVEQSAALRVLTGEWLGGLLRDAAPLTLVRSSSESFAVFGEVGQDPLAIGFSSSVEAAFGITQSLLEKWDEWPGRAKRHSGSPHRASAAQLPGIRMTWLTVSTGEGTHPEIGVQFPGMKHPMTFPAGSCGVLPSKLGTFVVYVDALVDRKSTGTFDDYPCPHCATVRMFRIGK